MIVDFRSCLSHLKYLKPNPTSKFLSVTVHFVHVISLINLISIIIDLLNIEFNYMKFNVEYLIMELLYILIT